MTCFAVDTDVLVWLVRSGQTVPLAALGRQPVLVTDTIWDEAGTHKQGDAGGEAEARQQVLTTWSVKTTLAPGSAEAETAQVLLDQGDLEAGEVSILAWAIHHAEIVPVFHERQALLRAIEEMPGRPVLSFHGFLGLLVELGLPARAAKTISERYCARLTWKNSSRPVVPQWWTDGLGSIATARQAWDPLLSQS